MTLLPGPDKLRVTEGPESVAKWTNKDPVICWMMVPSCCGRLRKYWRSTGNVTWTGVEPHCTSNGGGGGNGCQPSPRAHAVAAAANRNIAVTVRTSLTRLMLTLSFLAARASQAPPRVR